MLIQIILVTALAVPALILLLPTRGARGLAIRRLTLLAVLLVGIVAIIWPQMTDTVARTLGVGRGADLLLYGLIVVFLSYSLSTSAHIRRVDRQISELARAQALLEARTRGDASDAAARTTLPVRERPVEEPQQPRALGEDPPPR
ncbi:DUF2304 domain-containing protein [Agrococcus sp. TF02-05]|uniref:DUF2304 domain-containing protein n=1 Tax=Agrococcus sp. TF02-05 TaxID=2815211 RepID=UPI001AA0E81C|nr:DUF2304 domain-containing protein [Agrococcus sp. TF02-05]MBO1770706.1 DUF2304 domain-containing protein [Agrococcus sp. TF02-05]